MPKSIGAPATKRASIVRNGSNQAVQLRRELKFPENVKKYAFVSRKTRCFFHL